MSCISDFLRDRSVLVTGATGFIGKALVEKLLRSCPEVDKIYMLVRPKRGQDVNARFREYLKNPVFSRVRDECPNTLQKLHVFVGDVSCPNLGISEEDHEMLIKNISIVFHTAATVKFKEPLKLAFQMNVEGTQKMIQLCRELPKLKVFIHVSSAYSNADKFDIKEQVYKLDMEPNEMSHIISQHSDDYINNTLEPKLIGYHPNTYTFTKAMAENVVIKEAANLPTAIIRPSIVSPAWQEPCSGWVDNIQGVMSIFMLIYIGIFGPSFHCHDKLKCDFIPVDTVVNTMLAAAIDVHDNRPKDIPIYNCTSGSIKPLTWKYGIVYVNETARKYPSTKVLFYPTLATRKYKIINRLEILFFCFLPAIMYDIFLVLKGSKAKMVSQFIKFKDMLMVYEYFTTHEFNFESKAMQSLQSRLSKEDKERFPTDLSTIDWEQVIKSSMMGIRQYILKDDISSLPKARNKLNKLYCAHLIGRAGIYTLFLYLLYKMYVMYF